MSTTNTEYKMESPYLEAIQKIPGKTPGEKYQTLNCIARNLIDDNDVKNVDVKSSAELPECLVPIVQLEVAKIIHQADGIVAALKSDDTFINERALKVKWFFDGSNESITNSQYFNEHIFPHVSLTVRIKIIKNLAKYLMLSNKQSIAENFYIKLKEQYGEELVRPLCSACGEAFIRITTNEWKKPVTASELEIIYPRFPNFVALLLRIFTVSYRKFFPKLLKNHADIFADIVKQNNLVIKLSSKKCQLFLKNARNAFLDDPIIFMPSLSLKVITTMLNKLEFHQFFKKMFPQNYKEFCFTTLYEYLEYYPEEEKLNLLMSTFENIYGVSLLESVDLISFQPLLKNDVNGLVDIVKRFNLNINSNNEKCEFFFVNVLNPFLKRQVLSKYSQSLKLITTKLNKIEFYNFFKHFFPQSYNQFYFSTLYKYLEYYPEEEKLNLLMSTFENLYGISLLKCTELITPDLLRLLDDDHRIKIARKKMEENDTPRSIEYSWICYLPTNESIPFIKEKISKESDTNKRSAYLQKLIYTCSVNKDNDALLNVLEYIFMRHKNEQNPVIPNVLYKLRTGFDVKNLPTEHLNIVNQLVMFLHVKNEIISNYLIIKNLICDLIFSKLKNNEDFSKYIELYIEFDPKDILNHNWNILKAYPDYERRYLIEFIKHVCVHENFLLFVDSILRSMYDFNRRNAETEVPLENLSIKHFPLLYEAVENIVKQDLKTDDQYSDSVWHHDRYKNTTCTLLLEGENDIFSSFVDTSNLPKESSSEKIQFHDSSVIKLLQKSPEKIVENWNKYLELCKNNITRRNLARRFLRYTRWHQDLPIMFASQCLKELEIKENVDNHRNICILAVLYESSSYEKFITPFIPKSKTLDLTNSIIKDEYKFNCSILWSLNIVNPPVSFSPIFEFCQGDYVHDAVNTLNNIGRRVSVDKVIEFSKTLVDREISVKKHGIRLFCQVASHDQIHKKMLHLWKKEKHLSARQVVYQFIFKLFIDSPSSQSWRTVQTCMDEVKSEDYFWESIFDVSEIPDDFYERYISKLLKTVERIEKTEKDFGPSQSQGYIAYILSSSSCRSYLFSEEFHQYIIKNYIADFSRPGYLLFDSCQSYIIKKYIAEADDNFESRLSFLTDLISEIVTTSWNIPSAYDTNLLPANFFINKLVAYICDMKCDHIKIRTAKAVLDTLLTVLKREQLGTSFLDLVYVGILNDEFTIDQMTHYLVQLIPLLIDIYSSKLMSTIVQHFTKPFHMFLQHKRNTSVIDVIDKLIRNNDKDVHHFTSLLTKSTVFNQKVFDQIHSDIWKINSEELHQFIIRHYFYSFSKSEILLPYRNYIINEYISKAGDKLETRLVFLSILISEIVKTSWNILSVSNTNPPTINLLMYELISCICNMKCDHIKIKTAKVVLDTLLTVLKPGQLGTSYLDLVYIGILDSEHTVDQMTHELVQLIPSLVGIYSSESMTKIVEHFKKPLDKFLDNKENTHVIDIIEKLVLCDDENVLLFTRTLLFHSTFYNEEKRYSIIIDILKKCKYPSIVIPVIDKFNSGSQSKVEFNIANDVMYALTMKINAARRGKWNRQTF